MGNMNALGTCMDCLKSVLHFRFLSMWKSGVQISRYFPDDDPINNPDIRMDDPLVIEALRDTYILPPSDLPYNLDHDDPNHYVSYGHADIIDEVLGRKVRKYERFIF